MEEWKKKKRDAESSQNFYQQSPPIQEKSFKSNDFCEIQTSHQQKERGNTQKGKKKKKGQMHKYFTPKPSQNH